MPSNTGQRLTFRCPDWEEHGELKKGDEVHQHRETTITWHPGDAKVEAPKCPCGKTMKQVESEPLNRIVERAPEPKAKPRVKKARR